MWFIRSFTTYYKIWIHRKTAFRIYEKLFKGLNAINRSVLFCRISCLWETNCPKSGSVCEPRWVNIQANLLVKKEGGAAIDWFFAKKLGTSKACSELVRVFLQDFRKNTVKSRVFMCVKRTISWKVGSDSEPPWVRLQTNSRTERDFSRKRRNDRACDWFLCKQKSERSKVRSDVVQMKGLEPPRYCYH